MAASLGLSRSPALKSDSDFDQLAESLEQVSSGGSEDVFAASATQLKCRECRSAGVLVEDGQAFSRCANCLACDVCGAGLTTNDYFLDTGVDILCSACFCRDCNRPYRRFGLTIVDGSRVEICHCRRSSRSSHPVSHENSMTGPASEGERCALSGTASGLISRGERFIVCLFFSFWNASVSSVLGHHRWRLQRFIGYNILGIPIFPLPAGCHPCSVERCGVSREAGVHCQLLSLHVSVTVHCCA
jgi:hypothetical protein